MSNERENQIEEKEKFKNEIGHSIRSVQAVLQYGVGAMVDFPEQTLVTAAPERWGSQESNINIIKDDRFAKALGVEYFGSPKEFIDYERFPEWYFCPRCRKFQPLKKWIKDNENFGSRRLKKDPHMVNYPICPECGRNLVVTRIVTVCEKGHLDDFPWVEWVHFKSNKPVCDSPELFFYTGSSSSEGLEGLKVRCSCGAHTSLTGIFDKECFENANNKDNSFDFKCRGRHPFKHSFESCDCYPRTVQRGASMVYFPCVYSSLVIPSHTTDLISRVRESNAVKSYLTLIRLLEPEEREKYMQREVLFQKVNVKNIAEAISESTNDVENVLEQAIREVFDGPDDSCESAADSLQYRMEEYDALTGRISASRENKTGDFSREEMDVSKYGLPHVKSIALIDKIRIVKALIGFSRLSPVSSPDDPGFVSVKENETPWYPAYEIRGEGIFIEFSQDDIDSWISANPEVQKRADVISNRYGSSYLGKSLHDRQITPKFIMLHTLSHLLISQLSFECGYNVASLSERIYCSEPDDEQAMAGIFIYTASGDSEGTLGGLVRQGRPDTFPRILRKAVAGAVACSNDPVCISSMGQGRDSLNLAACHSCALLPETSCEEQNVFLDRGLIVGTYEDENLGFWREVL